MRPAADTRAFFQPHLGMLVRFCVLLGAVVLAAPAFTVSSRASRRAADV